MCKRSGGGGGGRGGRERVSGGGIAADRAPILPLAEMERRAILQALDYTKGDRVMAAHLLGIGRTTLYRKLKEYEISN